MTTPSEDSHPADMIHYWAISPDGQSSMHVASVPASASDDMRDSAIADGIAEGETQGCDWDGWTLGIGSAP
jgi:hypothetical protein